MPLKISLKDVAKTTGYSVSTVSYALRNSPKIPKETRRKIILQAEEMGYKVDPVIRQLMSYMRENRQRTIAQSIALLNITAVSPFSKVGPRQRLMSQTMSAHAEALGYGIDEFWLETYRANPGTLDRILQTRGISGLIISNFDESFEMPTITWSRMTAVTFDFHPRGCPMTAVGYSHFHGMRLTLTELRQLGYRRIGLAYENSTRNIQRDKLLASFLFEHIRHPELEQMPIYHGRPSRSEFGEATWSLIPPICPCEMDSVTYLQWIERFKPQVIIGMYAEHYEWLLEAEFRIPEDIGFVFTNAFDDYSAVAAIDQNVAEVGRTAVDTLVAQIEQFRFGIPEHPRSVRIEGIWRAGKTVREFCPQNV